MANANVTEEGLSYFSTANVGLIPRRIALLTAMASLAVLFIALPFAKTPLPPVPAFIPIYESALIVNDLITAVLLFGQFAIVRSKSMAILASGYLYTAIIAFFHMLTFPGLFSTTGLLGAGPQSTAWIYMFWLGGFPLFVIAYALFGRASHTVPEKNQHPIWSTALVMAAVVGLASGFTALATLGGDLLPPIMQANHYTSVMSSVVGATWMLCLVALAVLWWMKPHSTMNIWLMVVLCVWICDIALSAVFNNGRYDLGFYAGRLFGLLAASFVLLLLLFENSFLYSRLAAANNALRKMALADPLTGAANRRAFETALDQEWRRMRRSQSALSLLMVDVDHFKQFNDTYGHTEGDACLRAVAETLTETVNRAGDLVARYGGEEFVVLLPQTDEAAAALIGQRLCDAVATLRIPHEQSSAASHVTISVGVASLPNIPLAACPPSPKDLIETADRALYVAKTAGRARISVGRCATAEYVRA
jgi:diguanylate cyclase (GGDEF)-like protein